MESSLNIILGEIFKMARKRKKQTSGTWWKALIVLTFILSLISASILFYNKIPKYEYDVQIIQLDDNNFGEYIWVVDYLCDEWVEVHNLQHSILWEQHWFYASTWMNADNPEGECAIKVKRRIE